MFWEKCLTESKHELFWVVSGSAISNTIVAGATTTWIINCLISPKSSRLHRGHNVSFL